MVFSTYKVESNIGKTRYMNQKVPRSSQHGDYVRDSETIWREVHTEVLHVGISGQGLAQTPQKVGREGVLNCYPLLMMMTAMNDDE